ncbi:hypothetical protein EUGRSUZ_E02198 [Eucalyptus grandis]|uniref:Uncharacterized protein n=2 Tax=Eucalyptus grandis TaxID=71139 RepID=A0A059C6R2_EUCGR|nr:hypothetical protein EUGRSUZ_E02198 [Eucalyptus grandis]
MPQWVFPIEEDSISLVVSKDLYDKILGLALCVVLDKVAYKNEILVHVDGVKRTNIEEFFPYPLHSEHIYLGLITPHELWGVVDFDQIDGKYVKSSLTKSIKVKRWGLRILCKQLGDDFKVELRENQLIDPALLYEVVHESIDSPVKSSLMHKDNLSGANRHEDLQDCRMGTEEYSHIGSKRNHEFILTQGMRDKTLLTSNLTNRNENGVISDEMEEEEDVRLPETESSLNLMATETGRRRRWTATADRSRCIVEFVRETLNRCFLRKFSLWMLGSEFTGYRRYTLQNQRRSLEGDWFARRIEF